MRTGGNHDFLRTHLPQAITRQFFVGACDVIRHALDKTDKILSKITKGLRARQQRHRARFGFQRANSFCNPIRCRLAINCCVKI